MDTSCEVVTNQRPTPWGFWATVGFSVIIVLFFIFSQIIVAILFAVAAEIKNPDIDMNQFAQSLGSNGLLLAITTCATAPLNIGLAILFAKLRKGITIKEYFCLHRIGWEKLFMWLLVIILFIVGSDTLNFFMGRPVIPEFMISVYTTAYFKPLLLMALIIAAPLFEEIFFRGFLFKGLQHSKMGPIGAVILSSFTWSVIHIQYDFYDIATIFAVGLILGYARFKSDSIFPSIAMHSLMNLIATTEVVVYLRWLS